MKKLIIFMLLLSAVAYGQRTIDVRDTLNFLVPPTGAILTDTIPFAATKFNTEDNARAAEVGGGDLIAFCMDWKSNFAGTIMVDATINYGSFAILGDTVLTGIKFEVFTAGVFTANEFNGVALYKLAGGVKTLVAISANDGDIWKSTGLVSVPFTSTYTADAGIYYGALLYNTGGTTAAPSVNRILASSSDWWGIGDGFTSHAIQAAQTTFPATATFTTSSVSRMMSIY